jgi:hypothetical protein
MGSESGVFMDIDAVQVFSDGDENRQPGLGNCH